MNQYSSLVDDTEVIPQAVETMADRLERYFGEGDERRLRALVGAERPDPLQPALERWIGQQLDLDDPEIANAVMAVIVRRIERQMGMAAPCA